MRHPRAAPEFAQGRPAVGGARGGCGEETVGADARPRANPNRRVRGNGPEVDVPRTVRGVPRGGARDVGFARSRRRRGLDGIRELAVGNVGGERRRRGKRRRRGASPTKAATPNDGEAVSAVRAHDPGFENQARTNLRDKSPNLREASRESRERQPRFARVTRAVPRGSFRGGYVPPWDSNRYSTGRRARRRDEREKTRPDDPRATPSRRSPAFPPRPRQPLHSSSSTAVAACTAASSVPPTVVPPPFGALPGGAAGGGLGAAGGGPRGGGGASPYSPGGRPGGTGGAPPPRRRGATRV